MKRNEAQLTTQAFLLRVQIEEILKKYEEEKGGEQMAYFERPEMRRFAPDTKTLASVEQDIRIDAGKAQDYFALLPITNPVRVTDFTILRAGPTVQVMTTASVLNGDAHTSVQGHAQQVEQVGLKALQKAVGSQLPETASFKVEDWMLTEKDGIVTGVMRFGNSRMKWTSEVTTDENPDDPFHDKVLTDTLVQGFKYGCVLLRATGY